MIELEDLFTKLSCKLHLNSCNYCNSYGDGFLFRYGDIERREKTCGDWHGCLERIVFEKVDFACTYCVS